MNAFSSVAARCALVTVLANCTSAPDAGDAVATSHIIEFRSVSDSARSGWTQAVLHGEVLYLAPDPVISDNDIDHVEVAERPNQVILDMLFKPEAARRLHAATAESLGERMALLLNSDLLQAPTIRSPVPASDRRIQVGVSLPDSEAERIIAQLRDRWPAR